ncbi:MAG: hypothetical protein E2604_09975 [Flavobacterium sp.]|nr:hypothetical protein [Flavobacterium sp.]
MNRIKAFLDNLIQTDWVRFNKMDNGLKQSEVYNEILDDFKKLVRIEAENENFNFSELYVLLKSYQNDISELPFMGKFYILVNPRLLTGQLTKIVEEIEFHLAKKKAKEAVCDCEIKYRYNQIPTEAHLIKVGFGCDGYYNYIIYECSKCSFKWSSYTSDDSAGNTVFEKWNEEEFPNNNSHCN